MCSRPNFRILLLIILAIFIVLLGLPSIASADSFVVNTTDDVDDGLCDTNHCSLREAINAANSNPGSDTISFAGLDATGGDVTIQLNSFLNPLLDNGTTIDGTTVLGYVNEPVVNIVKASGVIESGISIQGSNCIVRGLSMAGFGTFSGGPDPQPGDNTGGAIVISGPANLVEGNVLGWGAWANSNGVWLASAGNSVIGNVISGNVVGVYITGPNQIIQGNQIGTDASGTVAIPNTYGLADSKSSGGGHVIGGVGPANRNVISGNNKNGINLRSNGNTIQGNFIGTNGAGTAGLGNGNAGIYIWSNNTLIGGPGAGNQVSGNGSHGMVVLSDHTNANNVVQGNKIGTDISGASPIPNLGAGIYTIEGGGMTYGGIGAGKGNIIAFNLYSGIDAEGPNQKILGNEIFSNGDYGIVDGTLFSRNSIYDNDNLGIAYLYPSDPEPPVLVGSVGSTISGTTCNHCLVEVFLAEPDPTGAGEGKEFLGSVVASNIGDFSMTLPPGLPYCANITTTRTDSHQLTSSFSDNVNVNCIKFGPYYLIPIWSFIIIVCGGFGILIRRRRPDGSRFLVPGSFAFGAVLGGGLLLLANGLPNVIIDFTPEEQVPYSGQVPTCDAYLDPAGLSPQDGAVLELTGDIPLTWIPVGDLPEGDLRWVVELVEVGIDADTQITQQNSVPISSFGMTPMAGSSYEWSLMGQWLLQDGETWLSFCAPDEPWTFTVEEIAAEEPEAEESQEPPPAETPTPTEEALCTSPLITASMNLTCRKGPDQAYEEAGYLLEGETAIPEGQNEDGSWFWILNPDWQGHCWVWSGGVETTCMSDTLELIAYDPLPTETPEPSACNRDLSRSECNMAGGTYRVGDNPYCECP